jgi:large subunit ribosomal protein L25
VAEERVKLEVKQREEVGSRAARRLRRAGYIPGVLYGGSGDGSRPVAIPERELRRVLTGSHGLHAILDVVLEGQKKVHPSILKDYQQDVIRGRLAHVDLMEVRLDRPIQAQVVLELVGEPEGVKEGGVLQLVTREVNVEALPMEIPDRIEVDVGALKIGDTLRLAEVVVREGVTYLDDPDETVIASVTAPSAVIEEVPEEEVEEVEGVAPEEAPEGAEAPAEPGAEAASGSEGEPGTAPG